MAAALAGALGSGATAGARAITTQDSMSGMAAARPRGLTGVLIDYGPQILAASALLVTAALARRRPIAAVPAAAGGVLLWWGMYRQNSLAAMYLAVAIGYAAWAATWWWTRPHPRQSGAAGPWPRRARSRTR